MDTLPNEIVLNEILRFMDQRTALNFLMSSPKYRHIVKENFEKYFSSDRYYVSQDIKTTRKQNDYPNGLDIKRLIADDAIINMKKFITDRKLNIENLIYYAQILDKFELLEEYKGFRGAYGLYEDRYFSTKGNISYSTTNEVYLAINLGFISEYVRTKSENRQYDISLRILKSLLDGIEEKSLFVDMDLKIELGYDDINIYNYIIKEFLQDEHYDVVIFILDNIYVSELILNYVIGNGDLKITKYALSRYVQDGGSINSLSVGNLVGYPLYDNVNMKYVPIFQHFLTYHKDYDFKYLYNGILENEYLNEEVRDALLDELNKYL
ncbi:Hypothetical protein ORPV_266 [Orpheovirus IHUMI-LCC2]|uniref:Uncharacterized protein n=1 Tax=Orpheovirus IHUMI-LCC2 TaxID=2023057 RepID=A0A2I2L3S7_9VIRU|nr:Hypothetical protein ORPV_266 [Orpheovirus IHUMI-LCC2]SNW62170.1 Hypothetical protein ORPV_266 [Orpheovirus IHUMI-LCC2]